MLEMKGSRRRPVLKLVEKRSRETLQPLIQKYVKPGSAIISDCWRAYNHLSHQGYIHYQVNHQRYFVHPVTGPHTQNIERAWRSYKEDIYRYRGNLNEDMLKNSLKFIEWHYWLGKRHHDGVLGRLFKDIRACYHV